MFSCEDEPPESPKFEWGRLSELQRRNTLCLPHMKSSYPIETQVSVWTRTETMNVLHPLSHSHCGEEENATVIFKPQGSA